MARKRVERLRADTSLQPVAAPTGSTYVAPEQQTIDYQANLRAKTLENAFGAVNQELAQQRAKRERFANVKNSAEALYQVNSSITTLKKNYLNEANAITDPDERDAFWQSKIEEDFPQLFDENADNFLQEAVLSSWNQFKIEQRDEAANLASTQAFNQAGSDFASGVLTDIQDAMARGAGQDEINTIIEDHIGFFTENNTVGIDKQTANSLVMAIGADNINEWRQIYGWVESRGLQNSKTPAYESHLDTMRTRDTGESNDAFVGQYTQGVMPLVQQGRVNTLTSLMNDPDQQEVLRQNGVDPYAFFGGLIDDAARARTSIMKSQHEANMKKALVEKQIAMRQPMTETYRNEEYDYTISKDEINEAVMLTLREEEGDTMGHSERYWDNLTNFKDPQIMAEANRFVSDLNRFGKMDPNTQEINGMPLGQYQAQAMEFVRKIEFIEQRNGRGVAIRQIGEANYKMLKQFDLMTKDGRVSTQEAAQVLSSPQWENAAKIARPDFVSLAEDAADGDGFFLWDTDAQIDNHMLGQLEKIYQQNLPLYQFMSADEINNHIITTFKETHSQVQSGDKNIMLPINEAELMNAFGINMYTPEVAENFGIALTQYVEDWKKANDYDDDAFAVPHPNITGKFIIITEDGATSMSSNGVHSITYKELRTRYYDAVAKKGSR